MIIIKCVQGAEPSHDCPVCKKAVCTSNCTSEASNSTDSSNANTKSDCSSWKDTSWNNICCLPCC